MKTVSILAAALLVAGCVTPAHFEVTPPTATPTPDKTGLGLGLSISDGPTEHVAVKIPPIVHPELAKEPTSDKMTGNVIYTLRKGSLDVDLAIQYYSHGTSKLEMSSYDQEIGKILANLIGTGFTVATDIKDKQWVAEISTDILLQPDPDNKEPAKVVSQMITTQTGKEDTSVVTRIDPSRVASVNLAIMAANDYIAHPETGTFAEQYAKLLVDLKIDH